MTGITIVDGDGHIMEEPNDIWTPERIDYDRWGDWVPRKEVIDEIYDVIHVGGAVAAAAGSCTTRWRPRSA